MKHSRLIAASFFLAALTAFTGCGDRERFFTLNHSFTRDGKIIPAPDQLLIMARGKILLMDGVRGTADTLHFKGNDALCFDPARDETCYYVFRTWSDSMWWWRDSVTDVWIRTKPP